MYINGIYENGRTRSQEKISDTVVKDTQNIGTEEQPLKISSVAYIEPVTYEDQVLNVNDKKSKNDLSEGIKEEEQWENIVSRMTEQDYEELSKEGTSLEEYNSKRLERALARIKKQRIQREKGIENQKEYIKEKSDAIKRMADYNKGTKKIVEKLIEADLPVTEENIEKIQNAMEMATAATPVSDKAKTYLIKNDKKPTIENLYKAGYSGEYSQSQGISETAWNGLIGQVKEILNSSGLAINEESLESAKWLLNQNLPLTEDTLRALVELNSINDSFNEEEVLEKVIEALGNGEAAESALLGHTVEDRVNQSITAFHSISDEAAVLAVNLCQGQEELVDQISLRDLKKAQKQVDSNHDTTPRKQDFDSIDIHTITIRRQLEEIRLKMTMEAGSQLMKNGIDPDTDSLRKIVEGLREFEDQYYHNLLKEGNTEDSIQNVETLKASLTGIEELKGMPSYVLGSMLNPRGPETIKHLLESGSQYKQSFLRAKEAYETLMTTPRKDMGDSILKAFRNVDAILEDMKLETTKANQRAVRILGYNQIEITEDNIQQIKGYDEQVNRLFKNLHPAVTVRLIKDGINPINTPIDELNQQIDEIKNSLGDNEEEKYSKFLWKLEKEKGITEEEKKSYIGIYRLLNVIDRTDGAALGAVIKAGQEVTMSNLLTAVRTMKNGGIRANVDDNFGTLEKFTIPKERITDQISAAFSYDTNTNEGNTTDNREVEKLEYINYLLQDVREEITPVKLQGMGNLEDVMQMSMEKLRECLLETPDNEEVEQEYWVEKTASYKQTIEESQTALKLLNDYEIPDSIHNIRAANDFLSMDQTVYKQWKNFLKNNKTVSTDDCPEEKIFNELSSISEGLVDSMIDQESMGKKFEQVEQDVTSQVKHFYENDKITSQDIAALQRISNGLSFLQQLARRESYEIPVAVGDVLTNVNVTILRNTGETGKVDINVFSETFGKISARFSVKEQEVKGLITCDNRLGLEAVQAESNNLKGAITQEGLKVRQIHFGLESKATDSYLVKNRSRVEEEESRNSDDRQAVSTNSLYSIAKVMVLQIRTLETKYLTNNQR